ncbi:MAG: CHASE2 domain-containing protein [Deltaproteobacteria bacterium]|nr:CHASE2 domain-containing protein [Deltaproteobacteria bacterium]MBW1794755.1 CHASE2 domain-containing protein [Deltaproteobacteria bacterium]
MGILKKDPTIFLGLGITLLFLGLGFFRMEFLDTLELKFYDVMMSLRGDPEGPSDLVLVDIDDESIEKLGHWPWPRSLMAKGIRKLNAAGSRVIGLNLILSEPQDKTGLRELKDLEELFVKTVLDHAGDKGPMFLRAMSDAQARLDNDKKLAEALQESGKVVLPVLFKEQALGGKGTIETDEALIDQSIQSISYPKGLQCPQANEIFLPIPAFLEASKGIGHINRTYDTDGTSRRELLLYGFNGLYIPSYTLRLAALYLNVPQNKIRADLGSAIYLGSLEIPTTSYSELMVSFKGPLGSFKSYSYFDVMNDKIPLGVFKNKLVLVSASATGIMNPLSTPIDPSMPVGEFSAHTIWTILNKEFVRQLPWGSSAEILMILVLGLVITFVLPRLRAMIAGMTFLIFLISLIGGSTYFLVSRGLWVQVTYPLLQLVFGYIGVVSIKYFVTETREEKVEGEPAERKKKLMQAGETIVSGDGFLGDGSAGEGLLAVHTRLGRYEVIKELGKGAMGAVYLGRDPRINRATAIKTVPFADDFEPEEAENMKEKFFQEARSAGTLSHPNIVTIYDAGEEQDLAYIAMEYLEGETLAKYTEKGNLLPMRKVIDYVADIADALDYGHQKGIVHRDIKPANIMLLKTGIVKITDFGIARMTATSQTRTGVVKGTPYYMSPEQFSGEKVDGRSDIFSLGTMLFQLLTGRLPFYGDNPAALMHQVMNVPHPDPRKINPKIVKALVTIINKALEKDREKRYKRASHMAAHLRELGKRIDEFIAKKKAEKR